MFKEGDKVILTAYEDDSEWEKRYGFFVGEEYIFTSYNDELVTITNNDGEMLCTREYRIKPVKTASSASMSNSHDGAIVNQPGNWIDTNNFDAEIDKVESSNSVSHPTHYNQGIEVWDFILSHNLNFLEGNIIKYVCRYKHKNGLEDLKKAKQYLDKLIETEENKK